jgi:hypothetical protein
MTKTVGKQKRQARAKRAKSAFLPFLPVLAFFVSLCLLHPAQKV